MQEALDLSFDRLLMMMMMMSTQHSGAKIGLYSSKQSYMFQPLGVIFKAYNISYRTRYFYVAISLKMTPRG